MQVLKKSVILIVVATLLCLPLFSLSGCFWEVAATYDGGDVKEDDVTTAANNIRANAGYEKDKSGWTNYIKNRTWDTDKEYADAEGDGTVDEFREYIIKQKVTNQIVEQKEKDYNIEVSDKEVEEYVDELSKSYEATYAGGMKGTFKSILRLIGMDEETFNENARKQLMERNLKRAILGEEVSTETEAAAAEAQTTEGEDSAEDSEASQSDSTDAEKAGEGSSDSADSEATTTDTSTDASSDSSNTTITSSDGSNVTIDENGTPVINDDSSSQKTTTGDSELDSQAWKDQKNTWYNDANVKVNDPPSGGLPYDPEKMPEDKDSSSSSSTASTDTSSSQATDTTTTDSSATTTDSSATTTDSSATTTDANSTTNSDSSSNQSNSDSANK
ncbi:MAG: SurA N-terminal domain-containing protein [Coriobacteriales bacterium]|nr:SurA N-terminal domain-containing protein [Coriobacteriales bacterium]